MRFLIISLTLCLWGLAFKLLVLTFSKPYCEGELREQKRSGPWKCFDSQGRLLSRMNYENGLKQGQLILYYPEGAPDTISHWVKGKMEGDFESYDRNGKLLLKATYKNGFFEGYLSEWDSSGNLVYRCRYKQGHPEENCERN